MERPRPHGPAATVLAMPDVPAPQLRTVIGKQIWARPANCAATTPATWCDLLDVTETVDHGEPRWQPWIQWPDDPPTLLGTPAMQLMATNVVTYREPPRWSPSFVECTAADLPRHKGRRVILNPAAYQPGQVPDRIIYAAAEGGRVVGATRDGRFSLTPATPVLIDPST